MYACTSYISIVNHSKENRDSCTVYSVHTYENEACVYRKNFVVSFICPLALNDALKSARVSGMEEINSIGSQ